jgi:hypothetical protein
VLGFCAVGVEKDTGVEVEGDVVPPEGARGVRKGRGGEAAATTVPLGLRPLLAPVVPRARPRPPEPRVEVCT